MVYSLNQIAIVWIILLFHTFICHFEDKYVTEMKLEKEILLFKKLKCNDTRKSAHLEELIES